MSRLTMAAAASALWLAASPVAAEPFQHFIDMCLETNGDRQAAGARAKALGWFAMPMDPVAAGESELEDAALFLSADPRTLGEKDMDDLEMLVTGWGSGEQVFDVAGVRMDACVVMTALPEGDQFAVRLQDLLGLEPMLVDGEMAWAFSRVGKGYRSETDVLELADEDAEALRRLATERKIYIAGVLEEDGMTGLMVAAIRPGQ